MNKQVYVAEIEIFDYSKHHERGSLGNFLLPCKSLKPNIENVATKIDAGTQVLCTSCAACNAGFFVPCASALAVSCVCASIICRPPF